MLLSHSGVFSFLQTCMLKQIGSVGSAIAVGLGRSIWVVNMPLKVSLKRRKIISAVALSLVSVLDWLIFPILTGLLYICYYGRQFSGCVANSCVHGNNIRISRSPVKIGFSLSSSLRMCMAKRTQTIIGNSVPQSLLSLNQLSNLSIHRQFMKV